MLINIKRKYSRLHYFYSLYSAKTDHIFISYYGWKNFQHSNINHNSFELYVCGVHLKCWKTQSLNWNQVHMKTVPRGWRYMQFISWEFYMQYKEKYSCKSTLLKTPLSHSFKGISQANTNKVVCNRVRTTFYDLMYKILFDHGDFSPIMTWFDKKYSSFCIFHSYIQVLHSNSFIHWNYLR